MKKKIILPIGLSIVFLSIVALTFVSYMGAYNALHKERQKILKTPKDYGLKYEKIEFSSLDNFKLRGWWIEGNTDKVILVAHGYGANRAGWLGKDKEGKAKYLDWLGVAPFLVKAGYSMLYFDMRASGESDGKTITLGKFESEDLISALRWQLENKGKRKVGLLGFSMGGNVALRGGMYVKKLIETKKIDNTAIIAIGPYKYRTMLSKSVKYWTSLPDFFIPMINFFAKQILNFDPSTEIDPQDYINKLDPIPILFIQSEKDEIGDVTDVKSIYNEYKGEKQIIIIKNAKRFKHYNFPKNNPTKIIEFFNKFLDK